MKRRSFIQQSCFACMGLAGLGQFLSGCATSLPSLKLESRNNLLSVPLSKFAPSQKMLLVHCSELEDNILLIREENKFKALYMRCTHEGVPLTVSGKKIVCPAHGSSFDFEGNVIKEPALRPLKSFSTNVQDEKILIHLT
ncbi:MAG: Rieske (2Fe-2S) protein [Niabella sp.]